MPPCPPFPSLRSIGRQERGRSLEIDALVTAVQEIGRFVKVATPTIDAVLALVQERGRQAGLYRDDISPVDGAEENYRLD
jgi:hypothetical protein